MINGKCPTWFVQKWLEEHTEHTANAPNTYELWPCHASTDGMHVQYLTEWPPDYEPGDGDTGSPPIRSDWTIFNERGIPVEFKKKSKPTRVGSLLITKHGGVRIVLGESIAPDEYDLFTRERK